MSLTGRFVGAEEARTIGLVNAVVPHDTLLPAALQTAAAIAETDPRILQALLGTYRELSGVPLPDALARERVRGRSLAVDTAAVEARRAGIIERGRRLTDGGDEGDGPGAS
jgi:enoyl-CoA hydratase/carnithine racemase